MVTVNFSKIHFRLAPHEAGRLVLLFFYPERVKEGQKKAFLVVRKAFDMLNMIKL
jgi:hypothetical protein